MEGEERGVDETVRRLLEPHPLTVERLVRSALREEGAPAPGRRWPRLALAAALLVLAAVLVPNLFVGPPPPGDAQPPAATPEPVRISISNADGFVTISSVAGSKWILVPGDDS